MAPFLQKTHTEAERTCMEAKKDQRSLISKYPEDFSLYYLGEFDDKTGKHKVLDTPQHVLHIAQLTERQSPQADLSQATQVSLKDLRQTQRVNSQDLDC